MYDPTTARFLQEDTYRGDPNDPLSLNLYTYCQGNPLIYYDPTGHFLDNIWGAVKGVAKGTADVVKSTITGTVDICEQTIDFWTNDPIQQFKECKNSIVWAINNKDVVREQMDNDIRKMVNPEGTKIDPIYGYATDVLEADHIVPMKEIVDMPGFSQLSGEQQIEVLNLQDNFIGLGKSTNASKGAKNWTDWQGHSKLGEVPSDVRSNMLELESSSRTALQKPIEERLKK